MLKLLDIDNITREEILNKVDEKLKTCKNEQEKCY